MARAFSSDQQVKIGKKIEVNGERWWLAEKRVEPVMNAAGMFYVAPKEYIQSDVFYHLKNLEEDNKEKVFEELLKLKERFLQHGIGEGAGEYIEVPLFPIQTTSNDLFNWRLEGWGLGICEHCCTTRVF